MQNMFSDDNRINSDINNIEMLGKSTKIWKLDSTLLNNPWIKKEITREMLK